MGRGNGTKALANARDLLRLNYFGYKLVLDCALFSKSFCQLKKYKVVPVVPVVHSLVNCVWILLWLRNVHG